MGKICKEELFLSYNCFHSCLGTVLKKYLDSGIDIALHSEWQFFFSKRRIYNNDNRFVGEYPKLYDSITINKIKSLTGIELIEKNYGREYSLSNIVNDIEVFGEVVIMLNKFFIDKAMNKDKPLNLLSTALLNEYDKISNRFYCIMGDNDMVDSAWISRETLFKSINYKPHGWDWTGKGYCVEKLSSVPHLCFDRTSTLILAAGYLRDSAQSFLKGAIHKNTIYGLPGLACFSEEILYWENPVDVFGGYDITSQVSKRLVDSAIFIQFVINQRKRYLSTIVNLSNLFDNIDMELSSIINLVKIDVKEWTNLKMLFALSGKRRQISAVKSISRKIKQISSIEMEVQTKVKDYFEKFLKK